MRTKTAVQKPRRGARNCFDLFFLFFLFFPLQQKKTQIPLPETTLSSFLSIRNESALSCHAEIRKRETAEKNMFYPFKQIQHSQKRGQRERKGTQGDERNGFSFFLQKTPKEISVDLLPSFPSSVPQSTGVFPRFICLFLRFFY